MTVRSRIVLGMLFAGVVLPCASAAGGEAADPVVEPAVLTVRVYSHGAVGSGTLRKARGVAAGVYGTAGIGIRWLLCDELEVPVGPECGAPFGADDVAVRVLARTPAPGSGPSPFALGFASIDLRGKRSVVATVYATRIARLAAEARMPVSRLLGWVIAHELTHLLRGSTEHDERGVMRAEWSAAELGGSTLVEWWFTATQGAELRARFGPSGLGKGQ